MSREASPPPIPGNPAPNPPNGTAAAPPNDAPPPPGPPLSRSNRPSRACTIRAAARIYAASQPAIEHRKTKAAPRKKDQRNRRRGDGDGDDDGGGGDGDESPLQCGGSSKIVTPLVSPPPLAQLPRWSLRSMWELASVLNFLHVSELRASISSRF